MNKPEQQESVEELLSRRCEIPSCNDPLSKCEFLDNLGICKEGRLSEEQFKQQLESFYKEKYLGGLAEKIEGLKYKISPDEEKIQNANYFVKWRANQKLDEVLSIIKETKEGGK